MNPLDRARQERRESLTLPKVAIAMPCVPFMFAPAVQALLKVVQHSREVRLMMPVSGTTIARKRNDCVKSFLTASRAAPETHLLCLDSDMVPPPDVISRLLRHDKDIVSGLYYIGGGERTEVAAGFGDTRDKFCYVSQFTPGELIKLDWAGCGCLLVRREVFQTLAFPWFEATAEDVGEDAAFCRKARKAGFEVWLDTGTEVGHIKLQNLTTALLAKPVVAVEAVQ